MPLWPDVGQILGLSRSATYDSATRGEIPVLRFGRRVVVPTAALRRMLELDAVDEAKVAGSALAASETAGS
jgi:hypothetical protein